MREIANGVDDSPPRRRQAVLQVVVRELAFVLPSGCRMLNLFV